MKKILLSLIIILSMFVSVNANRNLHYVTEQTFVLSGGDYTVLVSTDSNMIEQIDATTKIYLVFSKITDNSDGTKTGTFYYPNKRSAYLITRAFSIYYNQSQLKQVHVMLEPNKL